MTDLLLIQLAVFLFWVVLWWLVGAWLADLRGYPSGVGAFLTVLLGPIGVVVLLMMEDLRPRCADCKTVLRPGARVCHGCGQEVSS